MSKFKALQNDSNTVSRCIEAIKDACKYENWIDSFIQEYSKTNNIPTIDVVISLENFKGKNINWQYIKKFNMEPAYYYEDSNGKRLHIAEDSYGKSKVFYNTGFPQDLENRLNSLDNETLYEYIEQYVDRFINTDSNEFDLLIYDNIR